jgi:GTP-binding protein
MKRVRRIGDIPSHTYPEIAFSGRSNVGKSSALNALLGTGSVSPVSKDPGRTRELFYFLVNERFCFVDLPGYGYAKQSQAARENWRKLVEAYLMREENPKGIVQMIDIRQGPTELDRQMITWLGASGKPALFLVTKSDRLPRGQSIERMRVISRELSPDDGSNVIMFSAKTGSGKKEAWSALESFLFRETGSFH